MAGDLLRIGPRRRPPRDLLFLAPLLLFVAAFALVPVALYFGATLAASGGLAGLHAAASDPLDQRAVANSLGQGALSAALALLLGYPVGLALGRYAWPGRSTVRALLLIPFLLPTLVVVFGVRDLFGAGGVAVGIVPSLSVFGSGIPAIVGTNLLFNTPLVALFVAAGCEVAPSELEDTVATLGGTPFRAYREAWGPPTWVGAGAGALLTFLFSALSFAPPLLLCGPRCYTVEAQIYYLAQSVSPTAAGTLAMLMVVLFLLPTAAYLYLLARLRARPGQRSRRPPPLPWRRPLGAIVAAATALLLAAEAALVAAVAYRSVRPYPNAPIGGAWGTLFSSATADRLGLSVGQLLGNTFAFAAGAALLAVLLGLAAGHAVARRRRRATVTALVLFVPLLLSPVVLAIALSEFWRPLLGGNANVWALVVASQAVLALPFALQSLDLPLAGVPRDAADAARTLGATGWQAYLDVDLPRVRGGVATAGLFALALGLGEFTATNFLVAVARPDTTLPVALYNLSSTRYVPLQDALAGLLLLVSLAAFVALALGGRRVEF
ncbi:MAG TPA: hypothetical protein VMG36_07380 [Thermoplasmata archaeon]|nr:hypothetical protein [Thermoplasmata archaeon]